MQLPGGLLRAGERRRALRFRPADGELELAVGECGQAEGSVPHRVTLALCAALESVGGEPATPEAVRALCVADRQFLMQRLAIRMGLDRSWLTARCTGCGSPYDFAIELSSLPVQEAGEGYPYAEVEAGGVRLRARVPTGEDQEAVAELEEAEALRALIARCLEGADGGAVEPEALDARTLGAVEAALARISPGVVTEVEAPCPACGERQQVQVDPYPSLRAGTSLLSEVHALASAYHWSEREILALPRHRRHRYLDLVDRARGVTG